MVYSTIEIAAKNTLNIEQGVVSQMALPVAVTNVPPINPNPGEEPSQIQIQCNNCHELVTSSVESSLRAQGWGFAICCLFFACGLPSFLVCCLPGFRQYTHYCPLCNALLWTDKPGHSRGHIALLIILSLILIAAAIGIRYLIVYLIDLELEEARSLN